MTLLARILSHGFAVAIVALLAIGLIYRGELFPEYDLPDFLDIGKLADARKEAPSGAPEGGARDTEAAAVAEAEQAEQGATAGSAAGESSQPQPPAAEPEQAMEPAAGSEAETAPAAPEAPAAAVQAQDEESIRSGKPGTSAMTPAEDAADSAAGTISTEPLPYEPLPASRSAPDDDHASPVKTYQLLADAREAYWLRDYDTAESKYLELTRVEPDNPDGYGELGNMYFSQGNWDQAAAAYYEAGIRLVDQGLLTQAEEMLAVIRGLNGTNAEDLARRIEAARGDGG